MKLRRNLKLLTAASVAGAAIAYLMDPVAGHRRRERLARTVERGSANIAHLRHSADRVKEAVARDSPVPRPDGTALHDVNRASVTDTATSVPASRLPGVPDTMTTQTTTNTQETT